MAKKKEVKEETLEVIETDSIKAKRDRLIAELKPKLLSKSVIKRGGPAIRSKYEQEKGYVANVQEINELGRQIGEADVSLGSLRGE